MLYLAADIGGTNCRIAAFKVDKNKQLRLLKTTWVATNTVLNAQQFVSLFPGYLGYSVDEADVLAIAAAGAVRDQQVKLTHGELALDARELVTTFQVKRCCLFNDFIAQAYIAIAEIGLNAKCLIGSRDCLTQREVKAAIGAGTGLGMSTLVPYAQQQWLAVASENGHAAFPFRGQDEQDYHQFMIQEMQIPFADGEQVLSGRGLALLHRYLTGERLNPREVGQKALQSESETLRWFSRFYARACRNWIAATLCTGGLWITGGIAAGNPLCVCNEAFFAELTLAPFLIGLQPLALNIFLVEDVNSGLWGAAQAALLFS